MPSDIEQKVMDAFTQKIVEETDARFMEAMTDLWVPEDVRAKYTTDKWERDLYRNWENVQRKAKDPVQQLRDEMKEELRDIKKAVNKMGIMLDSEAPTEEQLRKSKTLKDAYLKYKMVEKLVLGENK